MAYLGTIGLSHEAQLMHLVFATRLIAVVLLPEIAGRVGVFGGYVYVK